MRRAERSFLTSTCGMKGTSILPRDCVRITSMNYRCFSKISDESTVAPFKPTLAYHRAADYASFMHSLGDMSKALNRAAVYISGVQSRFELPVLKGADY